MSKAPNNVLDLSLSVSNSKVTNKRLVVCSDGTWQNLENTKLTNAARLAQAIPSTGEDGKPQIIFYDEGIGGQSGFNGWLKPLNWLSKQLAGATGLSIDYHIKEAYIFLCMNYEPGDEIYLFGFSRGAYTVRSLAGLIYNCGLLNPLHIDKVDEAYKHYRSRKHDDHPNSDEMRKFREDYSQGTVEGRVPITFLGCWDTVESLGLPWKIEEKYRFHDSKLSSIIHHARHAVAVDEHRKNYDVTLMQLHPTMQQKPRLQSAPKSQKTFWQVWFPGDHGCVGGGDGVPQGLADAALKWMMAEAGEIGLTIRENRIFNPLKLNPNQDFAPFNLFGWLTGGMLPHTRIVPQDTTLDDLHESTKQRWHEYKHPKNGKRYRPKNLMRFEVDLKKFFSAKASNPPVHPVELPAPLEEAA
ncbi:MAG: DUF2235 domain-containing protein [Synechococcales bacterium]|nr:DUF2235 domain-containing protein [Synechococcales bacterium]